MPDTRRLLLCSMLCSMLVFYIETTGLDQASIVLTIVCTEDFKTGDLRTYEFGRVWTAVK